MKHILGSNVHSDTEIYSEKDSTYAVGLSKSKDNKYIFMHSGTTNTSEDRYLDANNSSAAPVITQPRGNDVEYRTDYFEGDVFHIYTGQIQVISATVN